MSAIASNNPGTNSKRRCPVSGSAFQMCAGNSKILIICFSLLASAGIFLVFQNLLNL
jgi:hypothetical protein